MGLTSALTTALNGLALSETAIDIYGNNIANAGTNGFKASRIQFSTQLARVINFGSQPSSDGTNGGTNPLQIGLGAQVAQVMPDFSQGTISTTNSPSDLAIQGNGFFLLKGPEGPLYTRNGSFRLDSAQQLSNAQGYRVQGYSVDSNYELVTTIPGDLKIDLGKRRIAQATSNVVMAGALSPSGDIATQGTLLNSEALTDNGNSNAAINANTLLTDIRKSGSSNPVFDTGTLSFTPTKGGRTQDEKTMDIGSGTKVSDLLTFMQAALGLQSSGVPTDADSIVVGASVSGGQLRIKGNRGTANDFDIGAGSLKVDGVAVSLEFNAAQRADGESATTAFTVYDSLGTPLSVRMTAVLESQSSTGTIFRMFLESPDQRNTVSTDVTTALGNELIQFDSVGEVSGTNTTTTINLGRSSTGALDVRFTVDFGDLSGVSATGSVLNVPLQDGTPPGTLSSYTIDDLGRVIGAFDNGVVRTLGQVVLVPFSNPAGLIQVGSDNYKEGNSSGSGQAVAPGSLGAGTIRAGAIEQSNTDIGKTLVDLIVASTNYRSNARVISSVDQLVSELLLLGRN